MRRHLFLEAEPTTDLWVYNICIHGAIVEYDAGDMFRHQDPRMRSRLNTALFCCANEKAPVTDRMILGETIRLQRIPNLMHQSSPFEQMFLSQPPATRVNLSLCYQLADHGGKNPQDSIRIRVQAKKTEGVRFGDILQLISENLPVKDIRGHCEIDIMESSLYLKDVIFENYEVLAEHFANRRRIRNAPQRERDLFEVIHGPIEDLPEYKEMMEKKESLSSSAE